VKAELTEEQEMLRAATRQVAVRYSPVGPVRAHSQQPVDLDLAGWKAGADLAWPAMLVPERYGGTGPKGGLATAAVVGEELGAALQPWPFVEVNVFADAVVRYGSVSQCEQLLPHLATGMALATWAIADDSVSWDGTGRITTARRSPGGWTVSGCKTAVVGADSADHMLLTAAGPDGPVQLIVATSEPGVSVVPLHGLDLSRRLAEVHFEQVRLGVSAELGEPGDRAPIERQLQVAGALSAVDTVGATRQFFDSTVRYARDRVAFGRPIGSFQAVKHQLADGLTWLEACQAAAWRAIDALEAGDPDSPEFVSTAKAFVGQHCPRIVQMCMQVHGGIAMTWEYGAHLYLRRVRTNDALYGSSGWHQDRICTLVGMGATR
jgi:alkylation response protein AidB-like acyl-CoA dehydrogenase